MGRQVHPPGGVNLLFMGTDKVPGMANRNARALRQRMTDAEQLLWRLLRSRRLAGLKFRRQHPVGPFVVDFACIAHRLVLEADGGQHAGSATDPRRDAWLRADGWRVLRFWNDDVLCRPEIVLAEILRALGDCGQHPHPPG